MKRRNMLIMAVLLGLAVVYVVSVFAQDHAMDFTRMPKLLEAIASATLYNLEDHKLVYERGKTWLADKPDTYMVRRMDGTKMSKLDWETAANAQIAHIDSLKQGINDNL